MNLIVARPYPFFELRLRETPLPANAKSWYVLAFSPEANSPSRDSEELDHLACGKESGWASDLNSNRSHRK